jgi:hypothetical protein
MTCGIIYLIHARTYRKGIGLIFPNPGTEIGRCGNASVQCGNANEPGDVGESPGKSSLFFVRATTTLESAWPEIGSSFP